MLGYFYVERMVHTPMKYSVEITGTLTKTVEVEVDTMATAKEIVKQRYRDEEIILTADDFFEINFRFKYPTN